MGRTFLAVAVGLALGACFAQSAQAATLDAAQMKAALHTATPEEEGLIDSVLAKVESGTLPVALVESTFLWAREKPKNQFQYFKRGLTERAARLGIDINATPQAAPRPRNPLWPFANMGQFFSYLSSRLQSSRR